eukprot:6577792-Pyramimonas_sp.AAC.1
MYTAWARLLHATNDQRASVTTTTVSLVARTSVRTYPAPFVGTFCHIWHGASSLYDAVLAESAESGRKPRCAGDARGRVTHPGG